LSSEQLASDTRHEEHNDASGNRAAAPLLGVSVLPTDENVVNELQLPDDVRGVVVTSVDDDSPAAGKLLTSDQNGPDIILSVEGTPVSTPEALRTALEKAKQSAAGGSPAIVTLRVYNVPSKSRRIERVRLAT
jgi:S1-C subfamily serine protease